ncbi:MAG: hypothetical protein ACYDDO_09235 [Acidiferrobacterales bacterium]
MNFLELIEQLTARVGRHQLPADPAAAGIQALVDSSALHYELATRIVRAIYEHNGCKRLTDPVGPEATFEALGPIRAALLGSSHTDVDAFHFMEDICAAVAKVFYKNRPGAINARTPVAKTGDQEHTGAELVRLDRVRRRNKLLA